MRILPGDTKTMETESSLHPLDKQVKSQKRRNLSTQLERSCRGCEAREFSGLENGEKTCPGQA